jgi:hypothetical protein
MLREMYTQCPACGRTIEIRENDPQFFEARFRAKGRAHTPAPRAADAPTIPGRCGVCGGKLPRRKRARGGPDIPTVLPADDAASVAARPAPAGGGQAPAHAGPDLRRGDPRPHAARTRGEGGGPRSGTTTFLGLGLLGWGLVAAGACAAVLCLLLVVVIVLSRGGGGEPSRAFGPPPPGRPVHGTPPPVTQFPGLLGYWRFDEGQGTRAADSSGNGLHATVVNGRWVEGVRGKALHLSGPGSYLDYGDSPRLSFAAGAPFTLSLWARTGRARGTLLSQRHNARGGPVIDILLDAGRVTAQVRQDGTDLAAPVTLNGGTAGDGAWHHVALTRDGETLELFLDGVSQGRNRGELSGGAITTNWRALGSERYWTANGSFGDPSFEGSLDEFCAFGRTLRADEVRALAGR